MQHLPYLRVNKLHSKYAVINLLYIKQAAYQLFSSYINLQ